MSLTFYYGSGSPFAWKVWLVLEHKAIPYEFRLLSFDGGDTKTPEFLAVNPRGRVPAILDDGFALWESSAIAEYLEERYPQNPLLPKDVKARATARRLAAEADAYLGPCVGHLADLALYAKTPPTPAEIEAAKAEGPGGAGALRGADDGPLLPGSAVPGRFCGLLPSAPAAAHRRPQAWQGHRQ